MKKKIIVFAVFAVLAAMALAVMAPHKSAFANLLTSNRNLSAMFSGPGDGDQGEVEEKDDGQVGQSGGQGDSGEKDDGQVGQSGNQGDSGEKDDGQVGQQGNQGAGE